MQSSNTKRKMTLIKQQKWTEGKDRARDRQKELSNGRNKSKRKIKLIVNIANNIKALMVSLSI